MFGYSSLKELPELPKYKLDSNQQIVIDELVENEENTNNVNENLDNTNVSTETGDRETTDTVNTEDINKPHSKQEAPMPEREGNNNLEK